MARVDQDARAFTIYTASEVNGFEASADLVRRSVDSWGVDIYCYEGFRLYESKAQVKIHSELEEVQTIGAMRLEALRNNLLTFKQFAYQIKIPPYEDKALREMGFNLSAIPSTHTRDALRHFVLFWNKTLKFGMPKVVGWDGRVAKV